MNKLLISPFLLIATLIALPQSQASAALPLRTWVSNTGSDSNQGTIASPCATFSGALAKTADGGEIDCLTPGDYGPVAIGKSITIDGNGTQAAITATGGSTAVEVNAGPNATVVLRHLTITSTVGTGIEFDGGYSLTVEDCRLLENNNLGIAIFLSSGVNLFVSDTKITNTPGATGILIDGYSGAWISLRNVNIRGGAYGLYTNGGLTDMSACDITQTTTAGVFAGAGAITAQSSVITSDTIGLEAYSSGAQITAKDCMINFNTTGVVSYSGCRVRLANNTLMNNGNALLLSGGIISTDNNNTLAGNGTAGSPNAKINVQ